MAGLLTWGILAFLLGFLAFLGTPVLVAPMLPVERRQDVTNRYYALAMQAFRRTLLMRREHSGYALVSSAFDTSRQKEKVSVGDDTYHYGDPQNWMTRVHTRPFGLVIEGRDLILHPMVADIGHKAALRDARGDRELVHTDEETGQKTRLFNPHVRLPAGLTAPDINYAKGPVPHEGTPKDPTTAEENTRKSQLPYKKKDVIAATSLMIAFAAGGGLAWAVITNAGGAIPDNGVSVGLWMMPPVDVLVGVVG